MTIIVNWNERKSNVTYLLLMFMQENYLARFTINIVWLKISMFVLLFSHWGEALHSLFLNRIVRSSALTVHDRFSGLPWTWIMINHAIIHFSPCVINVALSNGCFCETSMCCVWTWKTNAGYQSPVIHWFSCCRVSYPKEIKFTLILFNETNQHGLEFRPLRDSRILLCVNLILLYNKNGPEFINLFPSFLNNIM